MKKLFICIILTICVFIPCISLATTLKGGVEKVWTIESAKEEVFKDAKPYVNLSQYPSMDPNYNENKNLINKNQLDSNNRSIEVFSNGDYSVMYNNDITKSYYYNNNGKLQAVDFNLFAKNIYTKYDSEKYSEDELYPMKSYKHEYPNGNIIRVGFYINGDEAYDFEPSGKLTVHWIGTKCYNANGKLIMTRGPYSIKNHL